jgi:hypothetical protein
LNKTKNKAKEIVACIKLTAKRPKKAAGEKRIQHCGRNQQQQRQQQVYKSSTVRLLNESRENAGWLSE